MNILVTGATGFIGRALVLRLQRDGHRVTAWVRDADRASNLLGPDVPLVGEAPAPSSALSRAIEWAEAVINLAGEPIADRRWSEQRKRSLRSSRIGLTRTIVGAIESADSPPHTFISASAVGYYGADAPHPVDESSDPGDDFLGRLCRDWEDAARGARDAGVRVVNLRIGLVLAAHGGALAKMLPAFRARLGARLGDGEQHMPWIHLHDLLEVVVTALRDTELSGPVNAVAPGIVKNREFTAALVARTGGPTWWAPATVLRIALGKRASLLLSGQNARPTVLTDRGFSYRYATLESALDDIVVGDRDAAVCIAPADDLPDSSYLAKRGASHVLTQRTVIAAPIDDVFAYFSNAGNLGQLTPASMSFRILTRQDIVPAEGTSIEYHISLGPIRMGWTTVFESWEHNRRFVDVQAAGPYRSWWHEHVFVPDGDRTVMFDRVYYKLPLGIFGRIAHRVRVSGMLRDIFRYRSKAIARRFSTVEDTPPTLSLPVPRTAPRRAVGS